MRILETELRALPVRDQITTELVNLGTALTVRIDSLTTQIDPMMFEGSEGIGAMQIYRDHAQGEIMEIVDRYMDRIEAIRKD